MRRPLVLLAGSSIGIVAFVLAAAALSSGAAVAQDACEPSYPNVCIPPPPPNLNCPDIAYRDFAVEGDDPHGFDGNADGIGCESETYGPGLGEPSSGEVTPAPTPGPTATARPVGIAAAGYGPTDSGGPGTWALLAAGLAGAGLAWLAAATGAGFSRRDFAVERQRPAAFVPAMRPRSARIDLDR